MLRRVFLIGAGEESSIFELGTQAKWRSPLFLLWLGNVVKIHLLKKCESLHLRNDKWWQTSFALNRNLLCSL